MKNCNTATYQNITLKKYKFLNSINLKKIFVIFWGIMYMSLRLTYSNQIREWMLTKGSRTKMAGPLPPLTAIKKDFFLRLPSNTTYCIAVWWCPGPCPGRRTARRWCRGSAPTTGSGSPASPKKIKSWVTPLVYLYFPDLSTVSVTTRLHGNKMDTKPADI